MKSTTRVDHRVLFHQPALPDLDAFLGDVRRIVESGWLSGAEYVGRLEAVIRAWTGAHDAVAVSNASDGLIAALSVAAGRGGEVILPGFTYLATWQSICWAGFDAVVVDVTNDGLIDPNAVEAAITPLTSAILAVHLGGAPAAMDDLRSIADKAGVALIADAAHALGAEIGGQPVGRDGDVEVFSIGATKQIAAGEGGVVTARTPEIADRLRRFALQGHLPGSLDAIAPGMNLKVQELTAALALRLLDRYPEQLVQRRAIHDRYLAAWAALPLRLQEPRRMDTSALKDQLVFLDHPGDRDPLVTHLNARGIGARPYYCVAVPDLREFRGRVASAEKSRDLASRSLAVPIHARMTPDDVEAVCVVVSEYFARR